MKMTDFSKSTSDFVKNILNFSKFIAKGGKILKFVTCFANFRRIVLKFSIKCSI